MQDLLACSTTKRCEDLFDVVEAMISTWKEPFFFDACKNQILRMCNDLLKRLSRTVDTAFCGRVLIFLAKTLPLEEKSGLNLTSIFNSGNVTVYDERNKVVPKEADEDPDMETGEILDTKEELSYELYQKFWSLQSYFSGPMQLFQNGKWKVFEKVSNIILCFILVLEFDLNLGRSLESENQQNLRSQQRQPRNSLLSQVPHQSQTLSSPTFGFSIQKILSCPMHGSL